MRVRVSSSPGMCSSLWRQTPALLSAGALSALSFLCLAASPAAAQEVVLHTPDVTTIKGNWARVDSSSAASNRKMASADQGWSTSDAALANPGNYFEASFNAQAWTPYRVWLRLRGDSKWNESVWVQFSDSLNSGLSLIHI